jgi:hypothetical protein
MAITKSNKHELSLDHNKPREKGGCTLCYSWSSLMRALFGFLNLNHLTRTLLFLALSKVFLICWNEQKYPHTRVEVLFITSAKKRTVMCLYGVTGRSGHVDRTLASVRSALTGRVRLHFFLSRTLLESTRRWPSASGHFIYQRPVAPDDFTLIKWTDRTLSQRPVAPMPAFGQYLTLHLLPTLDHIWIKFAPMDLRHI